MEITKQKRNNLTKEEANKLILELHLSVKWFCPLIKDQCNVTCVCYRGALKRAHAHSENAPKLFEVFPNCCSNAMFIETEIYMH